MTGITISIGIAVAIAAILLTYIHLFNTLKVKKNQINNAFSVLDALFIKRSDLMPNIVAVAKQYMEFEQKTLMKITEQRSPDRNVQEYTGIGETDKIISRLMLQVENYPELKSNQQFLNLQHSFNECEEQISAGRRYLSASITDYNDSISTFPGNIIAAMNGMKPHEWEMASEAQRQNVNASNLFTN